MKRQTHQELAARHREVVRLARLTHTGWTQTVSVGRLRIPLCPSAKGTSHAPIDGLSLDESPVCASPMRRNRGYAHQRAYFVNRTDLIVAKELATNFRRMPMKSVQSNICGSEDVSVCRLTRSSDSLRRGADSCR